MQIVDRVLRLYILGRKLEELARKASPNRNRNTIPNLMQSIEFQWIEFVEELGYLVSGAATKFPAVAARFAVVAEHLH